MTSVPPASTNQVLTSWLLGTSPRSSASSKRFCVGSSDLSVSSSPSATAHAPSAVGGELVQHAFDVAEEDAHHGGEHRHQQKKAENDRQRNADKKHLHLRHQPRQKTEPDVEDETESEKRRRKLNADAERRRDDAGDECRDVTRQRQLAGREQRVAVVERGDDQVVHVGREDQRDAEERQKIADDQALLALRRVDRRHEAEAEL